MTGVRSSFIAGKYVRVLAHKQGEEEFTNLYRWQHIRDHSGAILVLRFGVRGEWLAPAGADRIVRIWFIDF